ncbi:MAG TPA: hypothetical protein VMV45_02525, partial [Casimicrobiaceae bacterium]|nr:hypothetical protein [Casimicrobiaceae bacterium]
MNPIRRRFLIAGVLGAATLAAAGWLRFAHVARAPQRNALDEDAEVVVAALIPILLQGALPDDSAQRQAALAETLQGVDKAIAGLPPHAQTELA